MNDRLQAILLQTRNADGGWPYLVGRQSRLEPTCWAILALGQVEATTTIARWRTSSGLIAEPSNPVINYAFNGLAALTLAQSDPKVAGAVAQALISHKGVRVTEHPAIIQNSQLQGWPWYDATFSWVEPTAWCTLALKKLLPGRLESRARVDEAERLLVDRACKDGGWNYGNTKVFGKDLYAHVPPTATAVLSMQDRIGETVIRDAIATLQREAPREGSSAALALSWLALRAVGAPTTDLASRLENRVDVADRVGNIANIAMMTYVLGLARAGSSPAALTLGRNA